MADAFRRLRALDRAPAADEILEDLVEFHRDRPGITERTLGVCTTRAGHTGYDLLAACVPKNARTVLDLGCGNGPLLSRLLARAELERVIGVDACEADLERARDRLGRDPRLELRCERGDAFVVPRGSVDALLSHHAFYLMRPPEAVVARIAHALRPGGLFAFVTVTMRPDDHPTYVSLMETFGALTSRDAPHFRGWGDRRVFSLEGLHELLCLDPGGFTPSIEIEEEALEIDEPACALTDRLLGFFYSAHLQRPETRAELRQAWIDRLERTRTRDGLAHLAFPFAIVKVHRR